MSKHRNVQEIRRRPSRESVMKAFPLLMLLLATYVTCSKLSSGFHCFRNVQSAVGALPLSLFVVWADVTANIIPTLPGNCGRLAMVNYRAIRSTGCNSH